MESLGNTLNIQEEFVTVGGVETSVLKLGQLNEGFANNSLRKLILIIPGNPGVPYFYKDFMQELYNQNEGEIPVWTVGHVYHVAPPGQVLSFLDVYSPEKNVCGLKAQISHKLQFIHEIIPQDVSLILIGHSIGCYIILNMLNQINSSLVQHCFLLFPTIERMAKSPNGQKMTPALCYFRWLLILLALFISILPRYIKLSLIKWWHNNTVLSKCVQEALLETLTPWTINYATYLAKEEMHKVRKLQRYLIETHFNKLSFYYGACDHWAPTSYYEDLINLYPNIDARLCTLNLKHAFVLDVQEGKDMAKILWPWAKSHEHND